MGQSRKILFSGEFGLENRTEELDIFGPIINGDSNYFINIKRLRETSIPEFAGSYDKINKFFCNVGQLLFAVNGGISHKAYKAVVELFDSSGVDEINLGTSKGGPGKGFGEKLRKQMIKNASDIILTCSNQPEVSHLLSLSEDSVGPDGVSDMIATLVYDETIAYTKRTHKALNISSGKYPNCGFENGIMLNPYKKDKELLLVPMNILHKIPTTKDWDDIDGVCSENKVIKQEIDGMIRLGWYKMSTGQKKSEIKRQIFLDGKVLEKIIVAYSDTVLDECNVIGSSAYFVEKIAHKYKDFCSIEVSDGEDSYEATIKICNHFRRLIEECKGYELLYDGETARNEKTVQKALRLAAYYYYLCNNPDLSPEPNTGRGPVNFEIGRGNDETVIEIKLASNQDTIHGFEIQIEEYAKAENTDRKVSLMIDDGHKERAEKVIKLYEQKVDNGENPTKVILISAEPKESVSKYEG